MYSTTPARIFVAIRDAAGQRRNVYRPGPAGPRADLIVDLPIEHTCSPSRSSCFTLASASSAIGIAHSMVEPVVAGGDKSGDVGAGVELRETQGRARDAGGAEQGLVVG